MKKLLPFAFIFLIACGKETVKPNSVGIVKYNIEGDAIQIADSSSHSVAKWLYLTTPSKGYSLQAYSGAAAEVQYMISFFIESDKIETGKSYSNEVTGTILRNSTDYASTKNLQGTYIKVKITEQKDQTLSGTFEGTLKHLNTNKFVEFSGTFENVKLRK